MRWIAGLAFLAVASLPYLSMLVSGERPAPVPAGAEELRILSPHRREVRLEYSRGFREWMAVRHGKDVTIEWLDVGGTSKIMKDLESRFKVSPQAPGVDLLFGGGVSPFLRASRQGWLARVDVPQELLSEIPARCGGSPVYDPDGEWFGVALSGFGILYNRILVERMGLPTPRTWEDLGRPEFFGWLGSGDPRSSGSVHMCYEIILQAYGFEEGWRLITCLCANVRRFGEGGGAVPREVAAGDVAAGMVIDQYAQTVVEAIGGDVMQFVLPEGVTVVNADAIAVIKGAPAPGLASRFIEYVLGDQGQRLLFQPAGTAGQRYSLHRFPVRAALYDGPDAPPTRPYEYRASFVYDTKTAGRRWRFMNDLIGVWLIDAHDDLATAWQTVIRRGATEADMAVLCAFPVPVRDIDRVLADWDDSRKRQTIMNGWAQAARKRYRELRNHE